MEGCRAGGGCLGEGDGERQSHQGAGSAPSAGEASGAAQIPGLGGPRTGAPKATHRRAPLAPELTYCGALSPARPCEAQPAKRPLPPGTRHRHSDRQTKRPSKRDSARHVPGGGAAHRSLATAGTSAPQPITTPSRAQPQHSAAWQRLPVWLAAARAKCTGSAYPAAEPTLSKENHASLQPAEVGVRSPGYTHRA